MDVHVSRPLKNFTTMRLGGPARFMADAMTADEMAQLCQKADDEQLPIFILGGGSNLIVGDEGFDGLVIRNRIPGFDIIDDQPGFTIIRVGAGESWDDTVRRTVEMNLSGIEALSAIPGTAGAAPVQNIGAYGQEVSDSLVSVEAYDITTRQFVTLPAADCQFSYRDSIFRGKDKGRYAITAIVLKLSKDAPKPPFYAAIQSYFDTHSITYFTPQIVRDTVIAIRTDKLPDPKTQPSAGSFFKNAIVEEWLVNDLRKTYPDMPAYELGDGDYKVPTGWLIEQAGFKGQILHGMKVHDKNALVLINQSATGYADLAAARSEITTKVYDIFRIQIEQEPLEI